MAIDSERPSHLRQKTVVSLRTNGWWSTFKMFRILPASVWTEMCGAMKPWKTSSENTSYSGRYIHTDINAHCHRIVYLWEHLNANCWIVWVWAIVVFRCTTTARKGRDTFSFTSLTSSPIFLFWTPVQVRDMQSPFNVYIYMHRSDRATADFVQWQCVIE